MSFILKFECRAKSTICCRQKNMTGNFCWVVKNLLSHSKTVSKRHDHLCRLWTNPGQGKSTFPPPFPLFSWGKKATSIFQINTKAFLPSSYSVSIEKSVQHGMETIFFLPSLPWRPWPPWTSAACCRESTRFSQPPQGWRCCVFVCCPPMFLYAGRTHTHTHTNERKYTAKKTPPAPPQKTEKEME